MQQQVQLHISWCSPDKLFVTYDKLCFNSVGGVSTFVSLWKLNLVLPRCIRKDKTMNHYLMKQRYRNWYLSKSTNFWHFNVRKNPCSLCVNAAHGHLAGLINEMTHFQYRMAIILKQRWDAQRDQLKWTQNAIFLNNFHAILFVFCNFSSIFKNKQCNIFVTSGICNIYCSVHVYASFSTKYLKYYFVC